MTPREDLIIHCIGKESYTIKLVENLAYNYEEIMDKFSIVSGMCIGLSKYPLNPSQLQGFFEGQVTLQGDLVGHAYVPSYPHLTLLRFVRFH